MFIPILAVEALLQSEGALPVNVKFFLEGQEEIGSPQLPALIASQRDLLACDLVLSADGAQYGEEQPALMVAFKGLAGVQIDVRGARTDLHSGFYGGGGANPPHAPVPIPGSLRRPPAHNPVVGAFSSALPPPGQEPAPTPALPVDDKNL